MGLSRRELTAVAVVSVVSIVLLGMEITAPQRAKARTEDEAVAKYVAREKSKSPELRRAEREVREQYDAALTKCYFEAIAKHGRDGYDRELDCGHLGNPP